MDFISGREWQYAVMLVSMIILIAGFVLSRNLPPKKKKSQIQRFASAALIPMALMIFFERPYVSYIPRTFSFREQNAENLTSIEEIVKHEENQTRNIQLLKEEVERLREELNKVNDYYGGLAQVLVTVTLTFCILRLLKKEDLEEIRSNQISKL